MTKHRHAELIKQWVDNKELKIQYRRDSSFPWKNCSSRPVWAESVEYRIKPEPIKLKYRVGLFCCQGIYYTQSQTNEDATSLPTFVRWITEEQEITIDKD